MFYSKEACLNNTRVMNLMLEQHKFHVLYTVPLERSKSQVFYMCPFCRTLKKSEGTRNISTMTSKPWSERTQTFDHDFELWLDLCNYWSWLTWSWMCFQNSTAGSHIYESAGESKAPRIMAMYTESMWRSILSMGILVNLSRIYTRQP
jgi:hypothetical protein